nr:flagellar biosynthesis protein FlhF [uncultured Tolumonas sp.]
MKIKRVFAKDMRTALAEVKELLGPDAVIMSNKKVTGGIEIVAAVDYQTAQGAQSMPTARALKEDRVEFSGQRPESQMSAAFDNAKEKVADSLGALLARQSKLVREQQSFGLPPTLEEQAKMAPEPARPRSPASSRQSSSASVHKDKEMEAMRSEMASIRKLLQHQLSGLMWQEVERREPIRALLIKQLIKGGFTETLADQLAGMVPEDIPLHDAWKHIERLLTQQLKVSDDEIMRFGGAVALLGPTGVGKTTTIAKLAARFAMKYGAEQVALITTDHYRIGAQDQLQTYGRIMGCQVRAVNNVEELGTALYQLRNRRLVLIDTAGMGQRDVRLNEQLDTLIQNSRVKIRHYLVLPATAQRRVLQEAYEHFHRIPLSGCILTKLDESLNLGDVLDVCIQNSLPISYVTNGQRVPEDIQLPNVAELVSVTMQQLDAQTGQPYYWSSDPHEPNHAEFYE